MRPRDTLHWRMVIYSCWTDPYTHKPPLLSRIILYFLKGALNISPFSSHSTRLMRAPGEKNKKNTSQHGWLFTERFPPKFQGMSIDLAGICVNSKPVFLATAVMRHSALLPSTDQDKTRRLSTWSSLYIYTCLYFPAEFRGMWQAELRSETWMLTPYDFFTAKYNSTDFSTIWQEFGTVGRVQYCSFPNI